MKEELFNKDEKTIIEVFLLSSIKDKAVGVAAEMLAGRPDSLKEITKGKFNSAQVMDLLSRFCNDVIIQYGLNKAIVLPTMASVKAKMDQGTGIKSPFF